MSGFTPGPWSVHPDISFAVEPAICECFGQAVADANARLIAAAPEQNSALHTARRELIALKDLLAHALATPNYGQDENSSAEAQAHIDDAEAAIRKVDHALAKARGEQA